MMTHSGSARLRALVLVLLLVLAAVPLAATPARAAVPQADSAGAAVDWLRTQQLAEGAFSGFGGGADPGTTADVVLALAAAGVDPASVRTATGANPIGYLQAVAADVADNPGLAAKLTLALQATGADPRNAGGVDLVQAIVDGVDGGTGWYGISFYGHALAVIALHSSGMTVPAAATNAILDAQTPEGSWGFTGSPETGSGDSNSTAVAIQALAVLGAGEDAIELGLAYLASLQDANGAVAYDAFSAPNLEGDANSTALAIQAFVAVGADPATAPGGDLMAALLTFQNESGAFQFQPSFPDDSLLATSQAIPALLLQALPIAAIDPSVALVAAAQPAGPVDGCAYHEVTQHNVCGAFNDYWNANGGLEILGYPLTEEVDYLGQRVQYFERARFEWHPENAGTPYSVLLTLVGTEAATQHPDALTPVEAHADCDYHTPTGHNLCGGFAAFWSAYGGLAVFGHPLTEELVEDGMTVQYFERARFEWQPGVWPERYDVLLGRLAAERLDSELAR